MLSVLLALLMAGSPAAQAQGALGYYRSPALSADTIVFTAQGDLWAVPLSGGDARELTSHPGVETSAAISPDGRTVAFSAQYEGPTEVYIMPIEGGMPRRLTYDGGADWVRGWTPDGKVLFTSNMHSSLPAVRLYEIDAVTRARTAVPLRQASEGAFDSNGRTLFFTRLPFQGSHTKRYKGGTAQQLWKYADGAAEAVPLTRSYDGTSKNPMYWKGRVYFLTDRDGSMNLWSMDADGGDLKQLTRHRGWDIQSASLCNGKIAYQLGADIRMYDVTTRQDRLIDIRLSSDLERMREHWVHNPMEYLTAVSLAEDGERIALTARGRVFVMPVKQGRRVEVTRKDGVRYRYAIFTPDGKSILALADESGETEWWRFPANGVGAPAQLTSDGEVTRLHGAVSPDGKWLAYTDKRQQLWLLDLETHAQTRVEANEDGDPGDLDWSPDSKWFAFVSPTETFGRIKLYSVAEHRALTVTSERSDSYSPSWSPDGHWLYFLSDRSFQSLIGAPWGAREPEPVFDRQAKIYALALQPGVRWPFQPADELHPDSVDKAAAKAPAPEPKTVAALVEDGLASRLYEAPAPPGNYGALHSTAKRLLYTSIALAPGARWNLMALDLKNVDPAPKTLASAIDGAGLTNDRKHLLIRKDDRFYVIDPEASAPAALDKSVDLSDWSFSVDPAEEWRQMFVEAWRLERDFFYDRGMNGVDWPAVRRQYEPLVARVRDRDELNDLLAQMVSELCALHMFVHGGEHPPLPDSVFPASLGAEWTPDPGHKGYRIDRIYHADLDYPEDQSPLARPEVNVAEGDVIQSINGVSVLDAPAPEALLRNQAGRQVLLSVLDGKTGTSRQCIVTPMSEGQGWDLRYSDWELSRRKQVDLESGGQIGYVHLRAMGQEDIAAWERDFYPVFDRQGLIIDVRHNGGGNIDSWILEKLLRRAWMYWQPRIGRPSWNMQWAFRGKMVVLCDEGTASDGEAFTEGFRRLGLGKVIGERTWGGEIWLSPNTTLADDGIATAAEMGVYGPEGHWLIEGRGVEPDIVVDDPPHASYLGKDAQLEAAIAYLKAEIKAHPTPVPPPPGYPNKSLPVLQKARAAG